MRNTAGPFYGVFLNHHWLYKIGFDVEEEFVLTKSVPDDLERKMLGYQEWRVVARRWRFWKIPLTRWKHV